jgi:C2H2-type zinc finger
MSQRKITNFFSTNRDKTACNEIDVSTIKQEKCEEVLQNIKEEPPKEFLCILPNYQPQMTLSGNFKVKTEVKTEMKDNENKKKESEKLKNCPICLFSVSIKTYKDHLKLHQIKKLFQCDICPKKFLNIPKIRHHVKTHLFKFQCKLCNQKFLTKLSRNDHMKVYDDPDVFKCEICSKCFELKSSLREHLMSEHNGEVYQCRHCSRKHEFNHNIITSVARRVCPCKLS